LKININEAQALLCRVKIHDMPAVLHQRGKVLGPLSEPLATDPVVKRTNAQQRGCPRPVK